MTRQRTVLMLCTGNSCRSQMAEGFVNAQMGDEWHAYSAGTEPAGYVHPMAIVVMNEIGIDISHGRSQSPDELRHIPFDVVITVCDDAAENCPAWLGEGRVKHIRFRDPAKATGTEEEVAAEFRRVRDQIQLEIISYLKSLTSSSHPIR